MFEHHRKSPWFAERYDPAPDQQALRTRTRKEGWEGRLDKFLLDLESGAFDPDINEPTEEEPASPMKEQQEGANGLAEDVKREDDDDAFDFGHEDEGGNNDSGKQDTQDRNRAEAAKRGRERGEEVSVEPEGNTVMIRTIPPDIGRVKLEAVSCATDISHTVVNFLFPRLAVRYLASCTLHWVILSRNATFTGRAGFVWRMIRTCPLR